MLFSYEATNKTGQSQNGSIEAANRDVAITALQKRGLIVINIKEEGDHGIWGASMSAFINRIHPRDVVILSRQIATLFEAKVSVLSTFRLIAVESSNPVLQKKLTQVTDDIKTGVPISTALAKHPDVFSDFYVNMVRSGEESGKLSETFTYLAEYLDRSYALVSKAKNALIYPLFVIISFIVVMVLMLTFVIPRLSEILLETGQELPIYTQIVIGLSNFMVNYSLLLLFLVVVLIAFLLKYIPTPNGRMAMSRFKLSIPYVGTLYRKLYLSRVADNLNTLITSGVSMVRSIEITAEVVGNDVYREILEETAELVKSGNAVSDILSRHKEIPSIMSQMIKVGEESGKLTFVLATLSKFYQREVDNEVDTLVGLIEPAMIVLLGLAVGILLTSVLVPIYNVASGF
ncbi:MAG: type pilus assembly protein PilC [Patescibacteria group bacterium]|nr:type pilus assembly protein PilC [Patescibacteria group bacterium]